MILIWIFISSLSSSTQCNNVKQSLEPCSRQRTCRDCGDMWYFNYLSRSKLSCLHSFNSVETVLQVVWRTLKCSHSMEWLTRPAPAISSVIRAELRMAQRRNGDCILIGCKKVGCPEATLLQKNCLPFRAALSALQLPIKCEKSEKRLFNPIKSSTKNQSPTNQVQNNENCKWGAP